MYSFHFQVTALGVILHRGSYLRGFFNIVDFIVTVTSLVPILEFVNRSGGLESPRRYSYIPTRVSKHLSSNFVQDGLWGHVYIGSRHVVATRDCCGLNGEALYLLYGHAPCRRAHTEQDCWFQMASSKVQK